MGFTIFRACMTILFCILLLAMFIFPSQMLKAFSDDAEGHMQNAMDALTKDDLERAEAECYALVGQMDRHMPALERFLNHEVVDALAATFEIAYAAVRIGDAHAAFEALAEAKTTLDRLRGIELFSPNSLL